MNLYTSKQDKFVAANRFDAVEYSTKLIVSIQFKKPLWHIFISAAYNSIYRGMDESVRNS